MQLTVDKDLERSTLTVTATFEHPVAKVWDLYADPRK
ncbi:MAG: SRPBCC domain-containing protein, partial [Actinomycetales bacterium]